MPIYSLGQMVGQSALLNGSYHGFVSGGADCWV
jgi:hypothetical protein